MKFYKYPSLTNHYVARKQSFIDLEDEYVSTEKIHGSNISIIIDNDDNIDVAKRTAFLTELEREQRPWNTLATFADEQKELIINWANQVREITQELTDEQIQQVHFYGELYGSKVQQMEYQEALDKVRRIRFFDVHVIFENERRLVFSQDRLTQIFGDEYTAPVLRKGKLKDLILSVEELQSKLGNCGAEGQIYKPVDDYFVQPDRNGKVHYPVVKHKYDKWLETQKIKVKRPMTYTANELKLIEAVESRVTKQRLLNVLSHGDIPMVEQSTGLVIKEMLQDIKEEIQREEPEIELNEGKLFGKQGGKIAQLFKQYLTEVDE